MFFLFVNVVAAIWFIPKRVRYVIYKLFGITSSSKTFGAGCRIATKELSIGRGVILIVTLFLIIVPQLT